MSNGHIELPKEKIAEFCKRNHIRKVITLWLCSSHGDFRPDSDIDLLVEFNPAHIPGFFKLARMERELSELMGKKVDLRTPQELSKYFRAEVISEAEVQYAEG